jgi:hypothetical protein
LTFAALCGRNVTPAVALGAGFQGSVTGSVSLVLALE